MHQYSTPKSRWTALTSRDPLASNAFVYCVTTTRIYCRPNCPARLARRANIIFHDTAAGARDAGYRACMRCRPALDVDPRGIAIGKACAMIEKGVQEGVRNGVRELAREAGFTESHFCRVFKKVVGVTVGEYRAGVSRRTKDVEDVGAAVGEKDSVDGLQDEDAGNLNCPLEFDFNDFNALDRLDEPQVGFELESDWYDFSGTPDTYSASGTIAEVPYSGMFDDRYSNLDTEMSWIDTISNAPPLVEMDDGLQFLDL